MKFNKGIVGISVLLFLGFFINSNEHGLSVDSLSQPPTTISEIVIKNNKDFSSQGFPGSGSERDPYIIEGYQNLVKLSITDTTDHYIIRNNSIQGNNDELFGLEYAGVVLSKTKNGIFSDNLITNFGTGMEIHSISNAKIVVQNNVFEGNQAGLEVNRWSNYPENFEFTFIDNIIRDFNAYGIYIYDAPGSIIRNNQITSEGSTTSILLWNCANSIVENNSFENSFLEISGDENTKYDLMIRENTINNLSLLFLKDMNNIDITTDIAQAIIVNSQNILLNELNLTERGFPLQIIDSSHIVLKYSHFSSSKIIIQGSSDIEIDNNSFSSNTIILTENNILDIKDNLIMRSRFLISYSQQINVIGNFIASSPFDGITSRSNNDLLIENNVILENENYGIYLEKTNGTIQLNRIEDNSRSGIVLINCNLIDDINCTSGNNVIIANNTFLQNNLGDILTSTSYTSILFGFKGTVTSLILIIFSIKISTKNRRKR